MSTINQTQTDTGLEDAETQYWVEQYEGLVELEKCPNFKKVILEGYFKDRALDSVSLLATDYIRNSGKRPEVMEVLVAISNLQDHLATIKNIGGIAAAEAQEANGPGE